MKHTSRFKNLFILSVGLYLAGCGTKTDLSFIEIPAFQQRQIAYVPLLPSIAGLDSVTDIRVGWDELLYVVDAKKQEVICYDNALKKLSTRTVPGVTKVGQNRRLDLFALGRIDTVINGIRRNLPCIYIFDLKTGGYGLANATIIKKLVHPFYFTSQIKNQDVEVRFTDIDFLADNSFYVTRTGNVQNNFIGGPDDAVLFFNTFNVYQNFIQVVTASEGIRSDYFRKPVAISTFIKPPQNDAIRENLQFLYATTEISESLKVKFMTYTVNEDGPAYSLNQGLITGDTSRADGFLYTPSRFSKPVSITASGDGTNLIFVADQDKDSVYVFTNTGLEGVPAPPAAISRKNVNVSFGGASVFGQITAVAYGTRILYVADAARGQVFRYRLTTDFR